MYDAVLCLITVHKMWKCIKNAILSYATQNLGVCFLGFWIIYSMKTVTSQLDR